MMTFMIVVAALIVLLAVLFMELAFRIAIRNVANAREDLDRMQGLPGADVEDAEIKQGTLT